MRKILAKILRLIVESSTSKTLPLGLARGQPNDGGGGAGLLAVNFGSLASVLIDEGLLAETARMAARGEVVAVVGGM